MENIDDEYIKLIQKLNSLKASACVSRAKKLKELKRNFKFNPEEFIDDFIDVNDDVFEYLEYYDDTNQDYANYNPTYNNTDYVKEFFPNFCKDAQKILYKAKSELIALLK